MVLDSQTSSDSTLLMSEEQTVGPDHSFTTRPESRSFSSCPEPAGVNRILSQNLRSPEEELLLLLHVSFGEIIINLIIDLTDSQGPGSIRSPPDDLQLVSGGPCFHSHVLVSPGYRVQLCSWTGLAEAFTPPEIRAAQVLMLLWLCGNAGGGVRPEDSSRVLPQQSPVPRPSAVGPELGDAQPDHSKFWFSLMNKLHYSLS